MATKVTKKKAAPKKKADVLAVINEGLLEAILGVLNRIDGKLDLIYSNKPSTILNVKKEEYKGAETGRFTADADAADVPDKTKPVLINQQGEAVKLDYKAVMEEANKLVSIDQFGEKRGFGIAKRIILDYHVGKLEDVPEEYYSEIVAKFREAVKTWK